MSDTELHALTAVVNAETSMREGSNSAAEITSRDNPSMTIFLPYVDNSPWPNYHKLHVELVKRGIAE